MMMEVKNTIRPKKYGDRPGPEISFKDFRIEKGCLKSNWRMHWQLSKVTSLKWKEEKEQLSCNVKTPG